MNFTVGMVSLGCSKNLVDSEVMLGFLANEGCKIVNSPADAQILIVNTCGFIQDAKEESIQAILEMASFKQTGKCKALIVAGCLAQKYHKELLAEMPEIDIVIGTGDLAQIVPLVRNLLDRHAAVGVSNHVGAAPDFIYNAQMPRKISTPWYMAYLKIADGCNNHCSYCQIPSMRGRYRSRQPEDIKEEVLSLAAHGVKEINFIAQDTTSYGQDLSLNTDLALLLEQLEEIEGPEWYRLLYTYPTRITDNLIRRIASSKKVCRYLDIPLQHIDDGILKAMNRCGDELFYRDLIKKLRRELPGVVIRSTFIVGYPGESEEQFNKLIDFVQEMKLAHVGVFEYSQEEGTKAAGLNGQIDPRIKRQRKNMLMKEQLKIVRLLNKNKKGQIINVLVEGKSRSDLEVYWGRTAGDAPEIDGKVLFNGGSCQPGEIVQVRLTGARDYDLLGVSLR